jgi:hypothetical protein
VLRSQHMNSSYVELSSSSVSSARDIEWGLKFDPIQSGPSGCSCSSWTTPVQPVRSMSRLAHLLYIGAIIFAFLLGRLF